MKKRDVGQAAGSEMYTEFRWGNLKESDQLEDLGVEEVSIRTDLKRRGWESVGRCGLL
jgi:hypothetical protein